VTPAVAPAERTAPIWLSTKAPVVAEALLKLGYALVPLYHVNFYEDETTSCSCRDYANCLVAGKHPRARGWGSIDSRAEELDDPETWRKSPTTGIGIVTGIPDTRGRHLYIIDVDTKDGKVGAESLAGLEARLGPLPKSVTVRTGSGGLQFYFWSYEVLRCTVSLLAKDIDTRGVGGFGVAPPSWHRCGQRYSWDPKASPWELELAELPEAWVKAWRAARSAPRRVARSALSTPTQYPTTEPRFARALAKAVVAHPAWQWAKQNPDLIGRITWMGFATNLVAAIDGHEQLIEPARQHFHILSRDYARYSDTETDRYFDDALNFIGIKGGGPARWDTMSDVPAELRGPSTTLVGDARRTVFWSSES
jgi:hypothetical protein